MDKITTVGLDLAKSVFSVHGVDGQGRTVRAGRPLVGSHLRSRECVGREV